IGAGGQVISKIRQLARDRIRRFTGKKTRLELFVKVKARWSADERLLDRMGHNA
ncbi:MAG: KH domain-containing protein, partial [Candidatus Wallbacteria bacterium]|nr:KH domain-containing protein [Candidatus Wallbacteria bacterium]